MEKQLEASQGSFIGVREKDVLSAALRMLEHPGRVRGLSSYKGSKHGWLEHRDLYRKTKRNKPVDIEQLSQRIQAEVIEDVLARVSTLL